RGLPAAGSSDDRIPSSRMDSRRRRAAFSAWCLGKAGHVSFRTKLVTFFVLVVIVPMASVAFVLFNLIGDNETGKADARLASRQAVAVNLARDLRERADPIAVAVGEDPEVASAIRAR